MSYEQEASQIKLPGVKAGADLSAAANQYKFVKFDANKDIILCSAVTDVPVGILVNKPKLGEIAEVVQAGGTKVQADAAITIGARLGTSADGQAVTKTLAAEFVVAQARQAAAAAGDIIAVLLNCATPAPGA